MSTQTDHPSTIDEAAQIAYDLILRHTDNDTELADIIRRGVLDAYRVGANRALEAAAVEIEAVAASDPWALAGADAGRDAAKIVRSRKLPEEA